MGIVIFEASEIADKTFPDDIPEWPEWMYWRDIHAVYSANQLFRIGRVQAMCRLEGALYMIRHQAPSSILMEEYRPRKEQRLPLYRSNHSTDTDDHPWKKRLMKTWTREQQADPSEAPPDEMLNSLPNLVMMDALRGESGPPF